MLMMARRIRGRRGGQGKFQNCTSIIFTCPDSTELTIPVPLCRKPISYTHTHAFQLFTTYPRLLLSIDGSHSTRTIADLPETERKVLVPDGSLVVEGLDKRRESLGEEEGGSDEEI